MPRPRALLGLLAAAVASATAAAQDHPRTLLAVYPSGGRAGSTVEVDLRLSSPAVDAREVLVTGPGITAVLLPPPKMHRPDSHHVELGYKLFANRCGTCHDLPNPVVTRKTWDEWDRTIARMAKEKGAPVELVPPPGRHEAEAHFIRSYLVDATERSAGVRARLTIRPDAPPGRRDVRVVGKDWVSLAGAFEVGGEHEILEAADNHAPGEAQTIDLPVTVSGQLTALREVDYYAVRARKGDRFVARITAHRLNPDNDRHFWPVLSVHDESGKVLAKNTGHDGFDPLVDFTAPADGTFLVGVRDLFARGSPFIVYRLTVADEPYDTALFPAGVRSGSSATAALYGENLKHGPVRVTPAATGARGLRSVDTPYGPRPFVASDLPDATAAPGGTTGVPALPAALNGRITQPGQVDRYRFRLAESQVPAEWSFDVFAGRLGSPLVPHVVLRRGDGHYLFSSPADIKYPGHHVLNMFVSNLFARDPRFTYRFEHAGEYELAVADARGRAGPGYAYRVHVDRPTPDFTVGVTPDNPTVSPGSSIFLELHALRQQGVAGPIEVDFPNLPPGVTAGRAIIHPGQSKSFAVLTAAPDAKPGTYVRTVPVARAVVAGATLTRPVVPYEVRQHSGVVPARDELVVMVGRPPEWTVALEPSRGSLASGGGEVPVKIVVDRKNSPDAEVPFFAYTDFDGVKISGLATVPKGSRETTIRLSAAKGVTLPAGGVRVVVVSGLNEFIGVQSNMMNRASAAAVVPVR